MKRLFIKWGLHPITLTVMVIILIGLDFYLVEGLKGVFPLWMWDGMSMLLILFGIEHLYQFIKKWRKKNLDKSE